MFEFSNEPGILRYRQVDLPRWRRAVHAQAPRDLEHLGVELPYRTWERALHALHVWHAGEVRRIGHLLDRIEIEMRTYVIWKRRGRPNGAPDTCDLEEAKLQFAAARRSIA